MCNMCAFMHEGGYVISAGRCISRLFDFYPKANFQQTFYFYPANIQTFDFYPKPNLQQTFLSLSSNSPDKFYILKHIFPQRVLCYRVILHMGEHMAGCIIISQYCLAHHDKKLHLFRRNSSNCTHIKPLCMHCGKKHRFWDLLTWALWKTPFDIDLLKTRISYECINWPWCGRHLRYLRDICEIDLDVGDAWGWMGLWDEMQDTSWKI